MGQGYIQGRPFDYGQTETGANGTNQRFFLSGQSKKHDNNKGISFIVHVCFAISCQRVCEGSTATTIRHIFQNRSTLLRVN